MKAEASKTNSYENIDLMRQIRSKYSATANSDTMAAAGGGGSGSGGASGATSKYVNDLFEVSGFAIPYADAPIVEETKVAKRGNKLRKGNVGSGAGQAADEVTGSQVVLNQADPIGRRPSKLHDSSEL